MTKKLFPCCINLTKQKNGHNVQLRVHILGSKCYQITPVNILEELGGRSPSFQLKKERDVA